jgi:hypothetical protein
MSVSEAPSRTVSTVTTETVRHLAKPYGRNRENGPHLADLRAFVAACEGLPDDVLVRIENGYLDEGGRRNVTFTANYRVPQSGPSTSMPEEG